jgi:5-bromo-4-chloroindolyl phosphate hydrolysis protein
MNTTVNISKKEQKIINGMLSATKKKFDTLRNDLNNNISVKDFMQKYDICEMRGEYQPNTFRVKFDYRFRAFVQIIDNSINFISVCNREGAYK